MAKKEPAKSKNPPKKTVPSKVRDRGVQSLSSALKNRSIALAVCGSIGSVEAVKIIRELRRHGAQVTPFATPSALRFVSALALEWAASVPVVIEEGARVEYLEDFDAVVVAPATLNTVSKSAHGISDSVVTLLIATTLGRKGRILFVPTLNEDLMKTPAYAENCEKLKRWGADFWKGELEEGRLKMPEAVEIVEWIKGWI